MGFGAFQEQRSLPGIAGKRRSALKLPGRFAVAPELGQKISANAGEQMILLE